MKVGKKTKVRTYYGRVLIQKLEYLPAPKSKQVLVESANLMLHDVEHMSCTEIRDRIENALKEDKDGKTKED